MIGIGMALRAGLLALLGFLQFGGPVAPIIPAAGGGGGASASYAGPDWPALAGVYNGIDATFTGVTFTDLNTRAGAGTALTVNGPAGAGQIYRVGVAQTTGSAIVLEDLAALTDGATAVRLAIRWVDHNSVDAAGSPDVRVSLAFIASQVGDAALKGAGIYSNVDTAATTAISGSQGAGVASHGTIGTINDGGAPPTLGLDLYAARVGSDLTVWFGTGGSWRRIFTHSGVSTAAGSWVLWIRQGGAGHTMQLDIQAWAPSSALTASLTEPPRLALD